jgi:hypothetical protein
MRLLRTSSGYGDWLGVYDEAFVTQFVTQGPKSSLARAKNSINSLSLLVAGARYIRKKQAILGDFVFAA